MIEEHLRQDGCEVYYVDGLHSRVVVATFDTPERAAAWLAAWQDHAALEADRDALAVQFDMEREEHRKSRVALRLWQEQAADLRKERDALAAKVARVEAVALEYERRDTRWLPTIKERRYFKALYDTLAFALRAALADPAPEHAGTRAALDELRADQEQQAIHSALITGITELHEWNESRRADPAPDGPPDLPVYTDEENKVARQDALADLTADGYTCPCGSANLTVKHVHTVNGRLAPLTMQCDDCGRKGTVSTFNAPDAAADDAALDELRQSWWPRLDAVLGDEDEDGA